MNNIPETKKITPPYISVSKLEKLIELISTRNFNEISTAVLVNYGFSQTEAILSISTLRFLGLVNEDGKPAEIMLKLRLKGDVRKQEFEKIVRNAYKKIFEIVDAPQDLSSVELRNDFILQYGLSDRVANSAIPVFIKLCEFAGLKEEGSVVGRIRQRKDKTNSTTSKSKTVKDDSENKRLSGVHDEILPLPNFSPTPVADGRFTISIPTELKNRLLDDEKLHADWLVVSKAIRIFADKYIPKKSQSEQNENPGPQEPG